MKKRMLITTIVMMLVLAVALTTSSLAWFSASQATVTATGGTAKYLREKGVNVSVATKVSEGHPNILDDIKAGRISMVINTTNHGRDAERDGFKIRRSTVEHAIPCLTSMDTARELQRVMSAMRRRRIVSVVALQDLSLSWED